MANHRWLKFWTQDWQRDPALRMCGLAARGLWMELLCVAHDAEPYGFVMINGKPATACQIGRLVGIGEREASRLLDELENAGVYDRSSEGAIVSRRMVRDGAVSEAGRQASLGRWKKQKSKADPTGTPNIPPNRGGITQDTDSESESESESPLKPPRAKAATKRRTQISSDWQPNVEGLAYADERGVIPATEVLRFRNHHAAKGSPMADWNAAWRTWCDNAVRFGHAAGHTGEPSLFPEAAPGPGADDWGLRPWIERQSDAKLTAFDEGRQGIAINGWDAELLGSKVAEAAGLPEIWRGSWDALGGWLRDDAEISSAALAAITRQAERMWSRGETIHSIKVFDGAIRGSAKVAA